MWCGRVVMVLNINQCVLYSGSPCNILVFKKLIWNVGFWTWFTHGLSIWSKPVYQIYGKYSPTWPNIIRFAQWHGSFTMRNFDFDVPHMLIITLIPPTCNDNKPHKLGIIYKFMHEMHTHSKHRWHITIWDFWSHACGNIVVRKLRDMSALSLEKMSLKII